MEGRMMEGCERWVAISDREALDEPVSDTERSFLARHQASCPECSREAALFRALGDESADRAGAVTSERLEGVLRASRSRRAWTGPKARLVLSGVAAAAAVASLLSFGELTKKKTAPLALPTARVFVTLVSGDTRASSSLGEVAAGAVVRTTAGPACLFVEPGVNACAGENSELRVVDTTLERRLLELGRGRVVVSLHKQPSGSSFSVATAHGRVTATGTVFSVELVGETTVVRVEEGTVMTERSGDTRRPLRANEMLVLGQESARRLTSSDAERDRTLISRGVLWSGGSGATLEVPSGSAGAWVRLDGILVGPAPVSVLLAPGAHRFESGVGERVLSSGPIRVAPGRSVVAKDAVTATSEPAAPFSPVAEPAPARQDSDAAKSPEGETPRTEPNDAPPLPPSESGPTPAANGSTASFPVEPPEARSAAELLRAARSLRAQGRLREAAESYHLLQSFYPSSAEAMASYVSLGDVNLALGDAAGALASFDAYLTRGGPLTQEARYGRIRALEALGRSAEAERATEEFLRLHPNSVQARSLRKPR
jgi:ferric-dicitrate binding protein FerR (iron transport regulator)/TolA-binding protein